MKFKKIIGGTEEEAYEKFPWLEKAEMQDAVIDITRAYLVWEDGTWEDGTWQDGTWQGGIWKGGVMWSNVEQKYQAVYRRDGKFVVKK